MDSTPGPSNLECDDQSYGDFEVNDLNDQKSFEKIVCEIEVKEEMFSDFCNEDMKEEMFSDDSIDEPNCEIESEHETDSEQEADDSDQEDVDWDPRNESLYQADSYYFGRNKCFKWNKEQPSRNSSKTQNMENHSPGLRTKIEDLGLNPPVDAFWSLIFTDDILYEICLWTNLRLQKLKGRHKRKDSASLVNVDIVELKAFIGLLLFTFIFKSTNETAESLFSTDGTGRDIFRCAMSKQRFLYLLQTLCFDNPDDRQERKKDDVTAPISQLFSRILQNSQFWYSPGPTVCVDEIFVPFRGNCEFCMYIPKEAGKYGLKVLCMTDVANNYLYNAFIYSGKECDTKCLSSEEKSLSVPSQAVIRLVKPICYSGRNITADNWFSSVELVNELLKRGLTFVGAMKKNKKEIPPQFLPGKQRRKNTCLYGFTEDITLLSFVPKKSKAIILISSKHHCEEVNQVTGKPEIMSFYDHTKSGVEKLDQISLRESHALRRTRNWSMAIFFTLVKLCSGVNAFVLHQSYAQSEKMDGFEFMKTLAMSLTLPQIRHRYAEVKNLPRELMFCIRRIVNIQGQPNLVGTDVPEQFIVRKTCSFCPSKLKRRTRYPCQKCGIPICLQCAKNVCKNCFSDGRYCN